MSKKELFETISMIDDDLISEAGDASKKIKRIRISKIAVIAAALVIVLGITSFAATILLGGRSGHSYNIPSYYSVPDETALLKDIGIAPKIIPAFSSGFTFDSGYIVDNEDYDTEGNVFETYKGLQCKYKKGEYTIELYIDGAIAGIQLKDVEPTAAYKGSSLLYYSYANKLVPPNYKMTEQDKKDKASGKYVFSYGSPDVKITDVQGLAWEYAGLNYELLAVDIPMTKEELAQMAREMIDLQGEET